MNKRLTHSNWGGTGAPSGSGYTKIYSTQYAFATLKANGSIATWGSSDWGQHRLYSPSGSGYTKIYSNRVAFAALKADGSITACASITWATPRRDWSIGFKNGKGTLSWINLGIATTRGCAFAPITWATPPSGNGYTKIYANANAFAVLEADGSITAWGSSNSGGTAPSGSGYTKIYSTAKAFAALKTDGSITAWGNSGYGGTGAPSDSGYTKIYSKLKHPYKTRVAPPHISTNWEFDQCKGQP
jgi:alpha-tubulin suppressor-like RCC1 family protein